MTAEQRIKALEEALRDVQDALDKSEAMAALLIEERNAAVAASHPAPECQQPELATADAQPAHFSSDGKEQDRWIESCENACGYCGGSGHKDDVKPVAVKVKPLAWEQLGDRAWRAPSPLFGSFRVERYGGSAWQALWSVPGYCDTFVDGDFATAEDAMEAIEARIMAALPEIQAMMRDFLLSIAWTDGVIDMRVEDACDELVEFLRKRGEK